MALKEEQVVSTHKELIFYKDRHEGDNLFLHYGDLTDSSNISRIIKETNPKRSIIWVSVT